MQDYRKNWMVLSKSYEKNQKKYILTQLDELYSTMHKRRNKFCIIHTQLVQPIRRPRRVYIVSFSMVKKGKERYWMAYTVDADNLMWINLTCKSRLLRKSDVIGRR